MQHMCYRSKKNTQKKTTKKTWNSQCSFLLILLLYIPPQYQFILKEDIIYIPTKQFLEIAAIDCVLNKQIKVHLIN